MLPFIKFLIGLGISYLLGSIPTAYLLGKIFQGIDIREHGSKNVGATNAFRVLGKGPGAIVLAIDIIKGLAATTLVADFLGLDRVTARILLGVTAVIGHNWTVFLEFRGGKGIATSLGVLIGLTVKIASIRPVLFMTLAIWLVVFLSTGFVSLSSIIAAVFLPLLMVMLNQSFPLIVLGVVFCVFVVLRHRPNIKRLLSREEAQVKFPFKKRKSEY